MKEQATIVKEGGKGFDSVDGWRGYMHVLVDKLVFYIIKADVANKQ